MSEQLGLFASPPLASAIPRLANLPIPIPHIGFDCGICGAWPAYNPRLDQRGARMLSLELVEIVCFEHIYGGVAEPFEFRRSIPRYEWRRPGVWVEVGSFVEEYAADANYRWPQFQKRWKS